MVGHTRFSLNSKKSLSFGAVQAKRLENTRSLWGWATWSTTSSQSLRSSQVPSWKRSWRTIRPYCKRFLLPAFPRWGTLLLCTKQHKIWRSRSMLCVTGCGNFSSLSDFWWVFKHIEVGKLGCMTFISQSHRLHGLHHSLIGACSFYVTSLHTWFKIQCAS